MSVPWRVSPAPWVGVWGGGNDGLGKGESGAWGGGRLGKDGLGKNGFGKDGLRRDGLRKEPERRLGRSWERGMWRWTRNEFGRNLDSDVS